MVAREAKRPLTAEAFGRFLRWLSVDDERAVQEYQSIRTKLVRFFVHKGCTDADELFDETVDIVVGKIEACAEFPHPLAYCYGVAKNVWRQDLRERKSDSLDEDVASPENSDAVIHEQELKCLERCMDQLAPSDRNVVSQYHQGQGRDKIEIRRRLADGLGGENALRIKVCRIRKELRLCVVECTKRSMN
jgi:DNA-directed RNA polymerase specialized sigma24 family protein